jgi:ElaB/YqjD/DUF883 family membrane-anchored ribosome-binding protein
MAQAAAQAARKLKDVAETAEDALERDEADRLRNQIADLQADVSRLLHSLAEMGKARGEAVAETLTGAVRAGADTLAAGKDAAAAQAEAQLAEARVYVQAHPMKALGFAALAGVVLGLLIGRR